MRVRSAFSVTKALQSAVGFLPRAWGGAWLMLGLLFVVVIGGPLIMTHVALPHVSCLIPVFAILLFKLMTQGALYRIALFGKDARTEGLGLGGFQIGRPELRLLIATLIITAFVAVIALTVFIVFAIALSLSGLAEGYETSVLAIQAVFARHRGADYVFIIYLIAAWLFLVFVSLKFVLAPAANIAERRLVTLNALGLSAGNVGKLFIGLAALVLPFLFTGAFIAVFAGARLHAGHAGGAAIAIHWLLLALNIFVLLPLVVGFLASAYRQIAANRSK